LGSQEVGLHKAAGSSPFGNYSNTRVTSCYSQEPLSKSDHKSSLKLVSTLGSWSRQFARGPVLTLVDSWVASELNL
jgi:hypothetical protein